MIEAELKARLADPQSVRNALADRADVENAVYHDTYFDNAHLALQQSNRELRIRTKIVDDRPRHILTYKEPAVDEATDSKPEHESDITDAEALKTTLIGLGYRPVIKLTKRCENYTFDTRGRSVLATVVTVAELTDTFLEVETLVEPGDVPAALQTLRDLLTDLGVDESAQTTELYTDAVAAERAKKPGA